MPGARALLCSRTHTHTHARTHTRSHARTHTHAHTHARTHTHTHFLMTLLGLCHCFAVVYWLFFAVKMCFLLFTSTSTIWNVICKNKVEHVRNNKDSFPLCEYTNTTHRMLLFLGPESSHFAVAEECRCMGTTCSNTSFERVRAILLGREKESLISV